MNISDITIVLLTAALVGVTAYYAGLTRRMMVASEKQLKAFSRPYISIRLVHGPSAIYYLEIENTGRSAAINLKLTVDRDYEILAAPPMNLGDTHLFLNGVSAFAPGNRVTFGLGHGGVILGNERDDERRPPKFKVTATYEFGGEVVVEESWFDLIQYNGLVLYFGPIHSSINNLTTEFREIKEELKRQANAASDQ